MRVVMRAASDNVTYSDFDRSWASRWVRKERAVWQRMRLAHIIPVPSELAEGFSNKSSEIEKCLLTARLSRNLKENAIGALRTVSRPIRIQVLRIEESAPFL